MPIINYPFCKMSGEDSPARPILPIRLENPQSGSTLVSLGMIDTGADECAVPYEFGSILGLNPRDGQTKRVTTAAGDVKVHSLEVNIEIFDLYSFLEEETQYKSVVKIYSMPIDFVMGLKVPLLGVRCFLTKFILTVHYPEERFSVRSP